MKNKNVKSSFVVFVVLMVINAPLYIVYFLIKGVNFNELKESCSHLAGLNEEEWKYTLQLMNQQQLVIATVLTLVYLLVWWMI